MRQEYCYQLGFISKPHGLKGAVQLIMDTDSPENYKNLESVFVEIDTKLIPFFIETISINGNKAIIQFEDTDTLEKANNLYGSAVYVPLEKLPELSEDQYYYHDITGFLVIDKNAGPLGQITAIYELPQHVIFAFDYQDKEILAPLNDTVVNSVDKDKKEFHVTLPEGLIDIYLES